MGRWNSGGGDRGNDSTSGGGDYGSGGSEAGWWLDWWQRWKRGDDWTRGGGEGESGGGDSGGGGDESKGVIRSYASPSEHPNPTASMKNMYGHMQATMQDMHGVGIAWKYVLTPSRTLQGCNGKALLRQTVLMENSCLNMFPLKIVIFFQFIVK